MTISAKLTPLSTDYPMLLVALRTLRSLLRPIAAALLVGAPAFATPAHPLILAFGDSLTAGYQLPVTQGFTAQLERALRARGIAATVHNAGVSGDTSTGGGARLGWVLGGLGAKPDLVILELGANDMLRGIDPSVPRANLDAMLAQLARRHIPVLIAGMLAAPNLGPGYAKAFNAIYPDLARKYRAPLYPFFLNGVTLHPELQLPDHLHPTSAGVAVIVRGILPTVVHALPHG
jgi:acyl-CoA thioesterase-1